MDAGLGGRPRGNARVYRIGRAGPLLRMAGDAVLVAFLSNKGDVVFAAVIAGGFAGGVGVAALRLNQLVRAGLFVAAPAVAFLFFRVVNPEPGCTYDCIGRLVLGLLLAFGVVAWWVGLIAGTMFAWAVRRRRRIPN